jgi:hypothetical protein
MNKETCANQHTKPCENCPWRRKSLAGYLGASTPEAFLAAAIDQNEHRMPCHVHVNYRASDWRDQVEVVPQCAGRAIFLANLDAIPKSKRIMREPQIKPDPKAVFTSGDEFLTHHKSKPKLSKVRKKKKPDHDFFAELVLPADRVEAEIVKLQHIKRFVSHRDGFGDDNHAAIEAQIEILKERLSYGQTVDKYEEHACFMAAIDAADFLSGENDVKTLTGKDGWSSLARLK